MGVALQQAALRQPDLLPVYGSSEALNGDIRYRADTFFAAYPTGFAVIDVARSADTSLNVAQDLAALGPDLRGKKVVISFTPGMFNLEKVSEGYYAGNFSRLHAYALVFSPYLSLTVKKMAAQRMLQYPKTFSNDPILWFALHTLANSTIFHRIGYAMVFPLGQLDTFIMRIQDHFAVWSYLQTLRNLKPTAVVSKAETIDWKALTADARARQIVFTKSNPYGIQDDAWINRYNKYIKIQKPGSADQTYIANLNASREWGDLAILLEILKELGAQPLIMSRPINGTVYTVFGISPQAQQHYYTKLQALVNSYHMPLVDFQSYTSDRYFSVDGDSHTSREGWVIVDQTLDAFYHGNIH
jgi:D-alanine transfer protein